MGMGMRYKVKGDEIRIGSLYGQNTIFYHKCSYSVNHLHLRHMFILAVWSKWITVLALLPTPSC